MHDSIQHSAFARPILHPQVPRWLAIVLLALAPQAFVTADEPSTDLSPAERGLQNLLNKPYMAHEIKSEDVAKLWKVWPEPLRTEAAKATDAERRKLLFARYGHIEMPGRDLPMGFVQDTEGGWTMNCLACHGGKVAGQVIAGLPNSHFAFQTWAEDIIQYRVKVQGKSRAEFLRSLIVPLSRSNGSTNAQIFSVVLTSMRNSDLEFEPPRLGSGVPKMLHHDLDAPPFWHLKKKKMLYVDGFVEKSHRVIMQFVLIPTNSGERIKSWEEDFRDILAFAESVEPPPYPWSIDDAARARGQLVYAENCATCHGTPGPNGTYPEKRIPIEEIGTDRRRLDGMPTEHRKFFAQGWIGEEGNVEVVAEPEGYVAPPLDGIWASAPYFHNGSVPTLWHVLHPESRPGVWLRTEDGYDLQRVGLEVTEFDEVPSAARGNDEKRKYFNSRLPGKSQQGHDFPSALAEEERRDLLEYLKSL